MNQWCHPTISSSVALFSFCLQSFSASGSFAMCQLAASGGQCWSLSFSISPSKEYSGLISLKFNWFDLLTIWGALKSLLQHHSSKTSILQRSALFIVQLSHPYMTIQTFVSKVISLLLNTLCRFVITFLPRSNRLLISWLCCPSASILEPKKRESVTASTFSVSLCHELMGLAY